jgi:two-component system, sensor histidine kinase LadS
VLYLHQRERISAQQRQLALQNTDASTGLFNERIAMARFPQILLRSKRFERPCGAILIRWLDFDRVMAAATSTERGRIFSHLGGRLSRQARDIDTVARIDDDLFVYLIEAPVSREDMNALASQILTTCLRPSAVMPETKGFDLHLAVWLSNEVQASADEAMELLKQRIDQMRTGTQRRVQFVDTEFNTSPQSEKEAAQRAAQLVAKINSLEATQGLPTINLKPRNLKPN